MARSYTMRGVQAVADEAVRVARDYLLSLDAESRVHDVQVDPRFQHRGIDLLWERSDSSLVGVEVKGDRQANRGTYFFELVSNVERDTPGCFLYSEADLMLYVFVASGELHHLPLPATRAWFLPRASEFPLKQARTRAGTAAYTTVGAIVPRRRVLAEVEGAARHPRL
ncbi:MAG TPA: hypothetical protein VH208_07270 [Myxococcaceae bacterium]|nr:hypothetical protein [Myxococcaceae bacterium]